MTEHKTELDAVSELEHLLDLLRGSAVSAAVIDRVLNQAKSIGRDFPGSTPIARLIDQIQRRAKSLDPIVESSRQLAIFQRLDEQTVTVPGILAALHESGFDTTPPEIYHERRVFEDVLLRALDTVRTAYKGSDERDPAVIDQRLRQLETIGAAVAAAGQGMRDLVQNLHEELTQRKEDHLFAELAEQVRTAAATRDFASLDMLSARLEQSIKAGRSPVQIVPVQDMLSALQQAHTVHIEAISFAREVESRLLGEPTADLLRTLVRIDREVRRTQADGAAVKQAAASIIAELKARLLTLAESAPGDADEDALSHSLASLRKIDELLELVPEGLRDAELSSRCAALIADRLVRLNRQRLANARHRLSSLAVADIPGFLAELSTGTPQSVELVDWIAQVKRLLAAIEQGILEPSASGAHSAVLAAASEVVRESPLLDMARGAIREIRERAARQYLEEAETIVDRLESVLKNSARLKTTALGESVTNANDLLERFERVSGDESARESRALFSSEWLALDKRSSAAVDSASKDIVPRWAAELIASSTIEDLDAGVALAPMWKHFRRAASGAVPHLKQARVERRVEALQRAGDLGGAVAELEAHRADLPQTVFSFWRGRLERQRTVESFRPGREADLVTIALEYGIDRPIVDLLVDHFRRSGDTSHLGRIAALVSIDFDDQDAHALTKWCRHFEDGEAKPLIDSLASTTRTEALAMFVAGIAKANKSLLAQRVVFKVSEVLLWTRPDAARKEIDAAKALLDQRHQANITRFDRELARLDAAFTLDHHVPDEPQFSDAELIREMDERLSAASQAVEAIRESLRPISEYCEEATFQLGVAPALVTMLSSIEGRVRSCDRFLDAFSTQWTTSRDVGGREVMALARVVREHEVTLSSVGRVCRLARTFADYYQPIQNMVSELIAAHVKGGDTMTEAELTRIVQRLESEYRYDFRPGQDRFHLAAQLPHRDWPRFRKELLAMIREVREVSAYRSQLSSIDLEIAEQLRAQLRRQDAARRHAIKKLLDRPIDGGRSSLHVFKYPPAPVASSAALASLQESQRLPVLGLLQKAVAAAES